MISFQPLYTINCVNAFCSNCMTNPIVTYSAIILSHFNSAVNPLLYAYHLKDFRGALSRLFHCASQPDSVYRPSLISQHQQRMSEHYYSRRRIEPRIYIDSPVWRRQMDKQQKELDELKDKESKLEKNHTDFGLHVSTSDAMQKLSADIENNNDNGIEKFSSIIQRRSSQSCNNRKIFFISDSGNDLACEQQTSSLYAIVNRTRQNGNSI